MNIIIRRTFLIAIIALCMLFGSCKKWLDVGSKTQVVESELFSNQQGFMDALSGVYYTMAGNGLYGRTLTVELLDVIAQRYDISYYSNADYLSAFTSTDFLAYSPIKTSIQQIWDSTYFAIANVNNLLGNIDEKKEVFTFNNYNLIKGESLGLRGFLHFDLLRMFGPSYLAGADSVSIPYLKVFSGKILAKRISVSKILDSVITDLTNAEALLVDDNLQSSSVDNVWVNYRNCHFNKWAVKATLARAYLYKGDKINALKYAKEVIEQSGLGFVPINQLLSGYGKRDYTFSQEQLFALAKYDVSASIDTRDFGYGSHVCTNKCGRATGTVSNLEQIYETQTGGSTDARYLYLWTPIASGSTSTSVTNYFPYKYTQYNVLQPNRVPIIRLPEMYYIAAECLGSVAGLSYLNAVRTKRGLAELPATLTDPNLFQNEIFKEYQKEFYAEGVLFYYYKRLNSPTMLTCTNLTSITVGNVFKYVFPIPDDETFFDDLR